MFPRNRSNFLEELVIPPPTPLPVDWSRSLLSFAVLLAMTLFHFRDDLADAGR